MSRCQETNALFFEKIIKSKKILSQIFFNWWLKIQIICNELKIKWTWLSTNMDTFTNLFFVAIAIIIIFWFRR